MRLPRIGVGAAAAPALRALRRAAAACAPRLPQALPKSVGSPARAGRSSPEAVAAVVCCGPLGRVSRRSSGRRAASAAGEQALCLQRQCGLVRSGSLDIVGDMCLCEEWLRVPSFNFAEKPGTFGLRVDYKTHASTPSTPTSVALARIEYSAQPLDTGIDPSIELQLVQSLCNTHSVTPALQPQPNTPQP